jgi:Lrp/AsnC family transcriptional regulator, leucine-responsive regulatory protein
MSTQNIELDQIDNKIAEILMEDASLTSAQIGEMIGLSPSAANERVRKLKNEGAVKKIVALVDSDFMKMGLGAFIYVLVEGKENNANFLINASAHKNIIEIHHMTGEYSYILKVRCEDTKGLEMLITDFLKGQVGVTKTMTQIILSSYKEKSLVLGK